MKTKNILITAALVVGGLAALAFRKVSASKAVFEQMSIKPIKISDVHITNLGMKFDCKLSFAITNPTDEDFSVSSGELLTFKRIIVYKGNTLIGAAVLDLSSLELPKFNTVELKNIPFSFPTVTLIETALTLDSLNINQLTIVAIVDFFGTEYSITT